MNVGFKATSQLPTGCHGVERDAASCEGSKSNDAVPSTRSKRKKKAVNGTQYSNQNSRCKEKRHDRGSAAVQMREGKLSVVKTAEQ